MSIETETNADKDQLIETLGIMIREDPSFHYDINNETGQTVISGMGELHLEIIRNKLIRDFGLNVRVGRPRVTYKETVLGSAEAEGRFEREVGGRGHFAVVRLNVEHLEGEATGEPELEDRSKGGIPGEFLGAVREGINDAATSGPQAGYPMQNIKVVLLDGQSHPVDSSDVAFHQAGMLAFNEAVENANPTFLEPIMRLSITTPDDYFGAVTGDITSRRGIVCKHEQRGRYRVVYAEAPLVELFGYTTQLRSLTQGRGNGTMEPLKYAPVPAGLADKILRFV
jgi:elongation factor G